MGTDQHQSEAGRRAERIAVARQHEVANSTCIHTWIDSHGRDCRLVFVDSYRIDADYTVNGQPAKRLIRAHAKVLRANGDGTWAAKRIGTTAALRLLAEDARRLSLKAAEHRKRSRTVLDALREQGQRRMGSEPKEGE